MTYLEPTVEKPAAPPMPDAPVPKGSLKRTAAQLWLAGIEQRTGQPVVKNLVRFVMESEARALSEMGNFRLWRERAENYMRNDFSDRVTMDELDIFRLSNETLGIVRSGIGFLVARLQDDIFGSTPWMAVTPEPDADDDAEMDRWKLAIPPGNPAAPLDGQIAPGLPGVDQRTAFAQKIYEHAARKMKDCAFEKAGKNAVERVVNLGETILRAGARKDVETFGRRTNVWVGPDGKAVITVAMEYVEEGEELIEMQVMDDGSIAPMPDPQAMQGDDEQAEGDMESGGQGGRPIVGATLEQGEPGPQPTGKTVFVPAKDPTTVIPEGSSLQEWIVEDEDVIYEGVESQVIDWRNFRCATSYETVDAAPFRGHVYEMRLSDIRRKLQQYHECDYQDWTTDVRQMFDRLRADTTSAKMESRQIGPEAAGSGGDEANPIIKCLDFETHWDPEGNGNVRLLFGTVLMDHDELFFCEYLANVLRKRKTLYTVPAVYNLPNTWCGRGWWELFWDIVMNTDRLWNNMIHRDGMNANPITLMNADAVKEDVIADGALKPGRRFTKANANIKMADFIEFAVFPNLDEGTREKLEFLMKMYQNESGASSVAQGSVAELPALNTATGVQSVLASGSTLHKRPAMAIRDGLEEHAGKLLQLVYAMQAERETPERFLIGQGADMQRVTLTTAEVANLNLAVKFTMTRFHQRELLDQTATGAQIIQWYLALSEAEKGPLRQFVIDRLIALDIPNADKLVRMPLAPGPPAPPPIKESVNVNYKDIPAHAKQQLLDQIGLKVTPADVEEQDAKAAKGHGDNGNGGQGEVKAA